MKRILPLTLLIIFSLVLSACNQKTPTPSASEAQAPAIESTSSQKPSVVTETAAPQMPVINDEIYPANINLSLEQISSQVISLLKNNDFATLSQYVHPQKGLRFSPYPYISDNDRLLGRDAIYTIANDNGVYNWGIFDGSGEPIDLTFADYYARFIYSADFADAAQVAYNQAIGSGNSINNIADFYPGAEFVEYHFPGFDAQYEGMDWQSLRLVFMQENGAYYLIGIVHAEWTI